MTDDRLFNDESDAKREYKKAKPVYMRRLLDRFDTAIVAEHLGISVAATNRARHVDEVLMVHEIAARGVWVAIAENENNPQSAVVMGSPKAIETIKTVLESMGGTFVLLTKNQ